MFGTNLLERRSKPERTADHAWQHLVSAVNSAGDSVRDAARDTARTARGGTTQLASDAGDLLGSPAGEARRRAGRALDALAGHRPALPWTWLVGTALLGAAVGWAAGTVARAAGSREDDQVIDGLRFVDVDRAAASVNSDR